MIRSVSIKNAVKDALEIFQFDQWLRFYFVVEKNDGLMIEIPEDVLNQIHEDHPELHRLADLVNNAVTDYKRSQETSAPTSAPALTARNTNPLFCRRSLTTPHSRLKCTSSTSGSKCMNSIWTRNT